MNRSVCKKTKTRIFSCIHVIRLIIFLNHSSKALLVYVVLTFSFPVITHVLVRRIWRHDWGWLAMGSDLGPGTECWFEFGPRPSVLKKIWFFFHFTLTTVKPWRNFQLIFEIILILWSFLVLEAGWTRVTKL